MDLLQPILMASIIDQGVMQNDTAHILHTGLIMLGAVAVGSLGGLGCTIYSSIASRVSVPTCAGICSLRFKPTPSVIWTISQRVR